MKGKWLATAVFTAAVFALVSCEEPPAPAKTTPPSSVVEATISDMQKAMAEGQVSAEELVRQSLLRIATYEDVINAVIAVNPNALAEARVLDEERAAGKLRGPMHGIPVALKDNIQATGMPTTGGTLGLAGYLPPFDSPLAAHLKDARATSHARRPQASTP